MGDDNKILYGRVEQLTTREGSQDPKLEIPVGRLKGPNGPTPQHERYPAKRAQLNSSSGAKLAAQEWTKWREKNNIEDEEALEEGVEGVYEIGYIRGAEETANLVSDFVEDLCLKYPSIHTVQAIKDLRDLLKRGR